MIKQYDKKFKEMIVLKKISGESVSNLSKDFGISRATIYVWANEYKSNGSQNEEPSDRNFQNEYYKILHEKQALEEDMDALKKCISIFSKL